MAAGQWRPTPVVSPADPASGFALLQRRSHFHFAQFTQFLPLDARDSRSHTSRLAATRGSRDRSQTESNASSIARPLAGPARTWTLGNPFRGLAGISRGLVAPGKLRQSEREGTGTAIEPGMAWATLVLR